MNQHDTVITAPDDSAKHERAAVPTHGARKVVIPGPTADAAGVSPVGRRAVFSRGKLYGISLAWRGLTVLGVAFGIGSVWFVGAWVHNGRMPLGLMPLSTPRTGFGSPPSPILPPTWLLALLGLMALVSLVMMLLGTQDTARRMKGGNRESSQRR